jgi:hypothetical protein
MKLWLRVRPPPICGGLRTNAVWYGPFTEGAPKLMESE